MLSAGIVGMVVGFLIRLLKPHTVATGTTEIRPVFPRGSRIAEWPRR